MAIFKNIGKDILNSYTDPYHGKPSWSGLRGAGRMAGIGAAGGAVFGSMLPNTVAGGGASGAEETAWGAGIGAAVGGLALPIAGTVGALGVKAMTSPAVGRFALGVAATPGVIAEKTVKGLHKGGKAFANNEYGKAFLKHPMSRYSPAARLGGSLMKYTPEETYWDAKKEKMVTKRGRFKVSGLGYAAAGVIGAASLAKSTVDKIDNQRAGRNTGVIRATPNYLDNAGATGDLVFAMHQNRRG